MPSDPVNNNDIDFDKHLDMLLKLNSDNAKIYNHTSPLRPRDIHNAVVITGNNPKENNTDTIIPEITPKIALIIPQLSLYSQLFWQILIFLSSFTLNII